jgi:protein required for attachment to host cells
MKKDCLVVVCREDAKFFSYQHQKLDFITKFENPSGTLKKRDITTDRPGLKTSNSGFTGMHGVGADKNPLEHIEESFAKYLAVSIPQEIAKHEFSEIKIAAEPKMRGLLKAEMLRRNSKSNITWLNEDWNKVPNHKIEKILNAQ